MSVREDRKRILAWLDAYESNIGGSTSLAVREVLRDVREAVAAGEVGETLADRVFAELIRLGLGSTYDAPDYAEVDVEKVARRLGIRRAEVAQALRQLEADRFIFAESPLAGVGRCVGRPKWLVQFRVPI